MNVGAELAQGLSNRGRWIMRRRHLTSWHYKYPDYVARRLHYDQPARRNVRHRPTATPHRSAFVDTAEGSASSSRISPISRSDSATSISRAARRSSLKVSPAAANSSLLALSRKIAVWISSMRAHSSRFFVSFVSVTSAHLPHVRPLRQRLLLLLGRVSDFPLDRVGIVEGRPRARRGRAVVNRTRAPVSAVTAFIPDAL